MLVLPDEVRGSPRAMSTPKAVRTSCGKADAASAAKASLSTVAYTGEQGKPHEVAPPQALEQPGDQAAWWRSLFVRYAS
jgi:hypothetical protein